MMVRIVSEEEYYSTFPLSRNVFGTKDFNDTVRRNAEAVRHFVGYNENQKPRLGLIAGYRDGQWYAPYSAPFTELAYNKPQQVETIYDFISELTTMLGAPLHVSLPPDFYDDEMMPKTAAIFTNFAIKSVADFNNYYPLHRFDHYFDYLDHAARKNYNRAASAGFEFAQTDDIARAYAVIRANRTSRGFPLAMSLEQVKETVKVVKADFFIMTKEADDVAAAMVYHVSPGIVQVIYWGDAPGYSEWRPMNMFAYRLFAHYHTQGLKIVDIGPSSKHGIPNVGLCRFKESIGCKTTIKHNFVF